MEDHKQSRNQPTTDKKENILDLTEDMELEDQSKHKIFELNEDNLSPDQEYSQHQAAQTPPPLENAEGTDNADGADRIDSEPPAGNQGALDLTPEKEVAQTVEPETASIDDIEEETPVLTVDDDSTRPTEAEPTIEDEVNAAFDAVQSDSPFTEDEEAAHDETFDKLTGITEMVDDAVRNISEDETEPETPREAMDDQAFANAAAELDAAIEGVEEDEVIIDLTDIVDPSEVPATPSLEIEDDDDIIELVDIVDPAELEADMGETGTDEDYIELEDIIEPGEVEPADEDTQEPSAAHEAQKPSEHEEELALSDLDDYQPTTDTDTDNASEEPADLVEIGNLFGDDEFTTESADEEPVDEIEDPAPESISIEDQENDGQEELLQLTDILNKDSEEKQPLTEQVISEVTDEIVRDPYFAQEQEMTGSIASDEMDEPTAMSQQSPNTEIEAVVEHILKTKYADTIERMVTDAVEKAVERKIETIKRSLPSANTD